MTAGLRATATPNGVRFVIGDTLRRDTQRSFSSLGSHSLRVVLPRLAKDDGRMATK